MILKALFVVLSLIGVPPIFLGLWGVFMGATLEPPGGQILMGIGIWGLFTGSVLCLAACAALRNAQDWEEK